LQYAGCAQRGQTATTMAASSLALHLLAIASLGGISVTLAQEQTCEDMCNVVYNNTIGMTYRPSCISYCERAAAGEDPCDTCKYVSDEGNGHKACRFFMTAFLDKKDPDCYQKPLNDPACPEERFLDKRCDFVGWNVVKKVAATMQACQDAYEHAQGMTYAASCMKFAKMAAEGADVCDTCKYVTDQSWYHKACRFFMTAFVDENNSNCYHLPFNHDGCPDESFMHNDCEFVGWDELQKAIEKGLIPGCPTESFTDKFCGFVGRDEVQKASSKGLIV